MKQYRKASRGKLHGLFSIVVDQHTIFISLRVFTNIFAVDYLKDSSFLSPQPGEFKGCAVHLEPALFPGPLGSSIRAWAEPLPQLLSSLSIESLSLLVLILLLGIKDFSQWLALKRFRPFFFELRLSPLHRTRSFTCCVQPQCREEAPFL
jgi:hypothetical protein